ncbi:SGNH/GDSL hydrolase family protein [Spirosoma taeanense]|uniref:SGNH/GDSL hydrolase family protein n=1 Tax=Spirosoma taeanense TaxID=2735870 RepID=A0A6M5Y469_9BACT|nr:SGNH/GDSL hydrolase family protein [Spirosoma taeanense]QJW89338.1 SGNH/GDSL hydrolase family protein [Spirosoma taeanense]
MNNHTLRMEKAACFWGASAILLLGLFGLTSIYDQVRGNADGLAGNIAYQNVVGVLLILNCLGLLFSVGLLSTFKTVQNISLSFLSVLFVLVVVEVIGHLALAFDFVKSEPFVFRRFYVSPGVASIKPFPAGDLNPVAGRMHLPNDCQTVVNCAGDSLWRISNSVGGLDRQREVVNPAPQKKRIAILGDSFMEGYMVNEPDRCSSILERETGLEHLNFAVNGSNPVNYYLMYKGVAKAFCADVLIIGFLPANDFEILNEQRLYTLVDWPKYVPYWQGNYPNYTLRYSLANVGQSIFYGNHTSASLLKIVDSLYTALSLSNKLKADVLMNSSLFRLLGERQSSDYLAGEYTKYEQFSDQEWQYVRHSLNQLIQEARGKKVLIVSLPTLPDLKALKQGKSNRIDAVLADFCRRQQIGFIPLAPRFLAYEHNLAELYVACDGHWSKQGEQFAANALLHHPVYRKLIGLPDRRKPSRVAYSSGQTRAWGKQIAYRPGLLPESDVSWPAQRD